MSWYVVPCGLTPAIQCAAEVLTRHQICNNYAFTPELNERLSLFFLELKDGARVISLRRFVPQDFRLNERNVSSPLGATPGFNPYLLVSVEQCSSPGAIIRTEARRFPNQAVSWTHEGGTSCRDWSRTLLGDD